MDFSFFDNYPSKRMRFLRPHDTLSLFLHDIMTCMHISKKYNEIHGGRTNLTIRKHAKILTTPSQIKAKTLDSTDTVDFTHFRRTVNRYCELYHLTEFANKKYREFVLLIMPMRGPPFLPKLRKLGQNYQGLHKLEKHLNIQDS